MAPSKQSPPLSRPNSDRKQCIISSFFAPKGVPSRKPAPFKLPRQSKGGKENGEQGKVEISTPNDTTSDANEVALPKLDLTSQTTESSPESRYVQGDCTTVATPSPIEAHGVKIIESSGAATKNIPLKKPQLHIPGASNAITKRVRPDEEEAEDDDEEAVVFSRAKRTKRRVSYTAESDDEAKGQSNSDDEDWSVKNEAIVQMEEDLNMSDEEAEEEELSEDEVGGKRSVKAKVNSSRGKRAAAGTKANAKNRIASVHAKAGDHKQANQTEKGTKLPGQVPKDSLQAPPVNKLRNVASVRQPSPPLPPPASQNKASKDGDSPVAPVEAGLNLQLSGEVSERFGGRNAERFKFLLGKDRKDAKGRRAGDPGYDPRTLYLPPSFVDKLTGGQRQWWQLKCKHMDKVLLFKMGKFYEMFEMDSHIGAQELDLQYMKGEQPHCGFPEKNYAENAERLARKGYRVLVVEQTETPAQLEQRKRETSSKDKVVKREVCAILTRGTLVDGEMLEASPDAAYLMAVSEEAPAGSAEAALGSAVVGVCAVDAATGQFLTGQFLDDSARTRLRSLLSELRPVELVKPRGELSEAAERALRDHTRQPLVNNLDPGSEFWSAATTLRELERYFGPAGTSPPGTAHGAADDTEGRAAGDHRAKGGPLRGAGRGWPLAVRQLAAAGRQGEVALSALGACVWYLRQALLDHRLLAIRHFELLPGSDSALLVSRQGGEEEGEGAGDYPRTEGGHGPAGADLTSAAAEEEPAEPFMVLDSAALEGLEILENSADGAPTGTLLAQLDHCATPFGKRLLRTWLVRPLRRPEAIVERQTAVADLKGDAAEALGLARKELAGAPDMERLLARLCATCGAAGSMGRNASHVVLYEDSALKHVKEFIAALKGCAALARAAAAFQPSAACLASGRLRALVTPGERFPRMEEQMATFERAFNWAEAEASGRIVPTAGVDEAYDRVGASVAEVEAELDAYLAKQRKLLGSPSEMVYVTVGKDPYQMEVPERLHSRVPPEYEVKSQKKGYRRYWTPEIRRLLEQLALCQEAREVALRGILSGLRSSFCRHMALWSAAVRAIAELDALGSLALASAYSDGAMCRPSFSPPVAGSTAPWLHAKSLRHPILSGHVAGAGAARGGSFVPNDTVLGGDGAPPFLLLTGPNMGGKSTLLRQVCLAVIMAQVGADVPAEHFGLSPRDRVFVRMGARDQIMAAQSTFLIELSETATMLRAVTRDSLVALDELGRGTATSDGQAIAHAVLQHLAHKTKCLGMFSTHYHRLADDHASDPDVALHHMGCQVGTAANGVEEVTFLYRLADGACPKSYGVNVARLAGMPEIVLHRGTAKAAEMEKLSEEGGSPAAGEGVAAETAMVVRRLRDAEALGSEGDAVAAREELLKVWRRAQEVALAT